MIIDEAFDGCEPAAVIHTSGIRLGRSESQANCQ
jgi:hypothetical protein